MDAQTVASLRTPVGTARWSASIPTPATPLVGRASELDALVTSIEAQTGGLFTLTGPGGVGKTRLAIEVAHRLEPTYADGVAFVELATVTQADRVPDAIARALGISPRANAGIEQLTALLASRELLLVLDNLEQVIDAAPFIAQLNAACPGLTVLVTSRVRLRISSEHEISVAPLSLADANASNDRLRASTAIQLFADRARRVDPQFALSEQNLVTVAEICRRLDGLPLAIELAASRLRILPLPVLLERLDRRLPILTGGDRDLPSRQQSMRDTIAWSYELLDPAAKRIFRWISVFAGGLSLDSTEVIGAAVGLNPDESLEAVTSLVDSRLVERSGLSIGQSRFHLFETIREFGMEQLAHTGELEQARRFHAEYFLRFASRDAPRPDEQIPVAWVGRLATEHPNLRAAFDELCVPETAEQSLQFAAAMGPYWSTRGPYSEWQAGLSRAFALASPKPTIVKTHVLYWLTMILGASPDFPAALQAANRCVEMADQVGTTSDRAAALHVRAWVHECHEHWEAAREQCDQAIELSIAAGNTYMHAMCLMMKATSAYALGELDFGLREAEQAATIFRAMDDMDRRALIGCVLGMFAVAGGELALAATSYEESLRTWLSSESSTRWHRPLVGLADVAAAIGQFAAAARMLGATDQQLIVAGRDLSLHDRPSYARAEIRCREILGSAEFEAHQLAGNLLTPDDWLLEAREIVEAARTTTSSLYQ